METYSLQRFYCKNDIANSDFKLLNGELFIVVSNYTDDSSKKQLNITNYNLITGQIKLQNQVELVYPKGEEYNQILIRMDRNSKDEEFYYIFNGTIWRYSQNYDFTIQEINEKYYFVDLQIMGDEYRSITKNNFNDVYLFDMEAQKEFFSVEDHEVNDIRTSQAKVGIFGVSFNMPYIKKEIRLYDVRSSKKNLCSSIKHSVFVKKFDFANDEPFIAVTGDEQDYPISIYDFRKPDKVYKKIKCEGRSVQDLTWVNNERLNSLGNLFCYSSGSHGSGHMSLFDDNSCFMDLPSASEKDLSFISLEKISNKMVLIVFNKELFLYDFGNKMELRNNKILLN
jgi:hypothetical protein